MYRYVPIRLFDETVDHAQTEAAAFADLLCCEKWLEYMVQYFFWYALTVIGNGDCKWNLLV